MKEFFNPEPVEIEVQDKDGVKHIFKFKNMTPDDMDKLSDIAGANENKNKPGSIVRKQCSVIFGEDENFYGNFTLSVLNGAITYITEIMKNPNKEK